MKKAMFFIIAAMLFTLMFAGVATANDESVEDYVGKDIERTEDQDYVGKDLELAEGEMGIVSIEIDEDEDYVGKDIVLEESEVGIISIDEDDRTGKSNLPLYGGLGLLTIGLLFFAYKRK